MKLIIEEADNEPSKLVNITKDVKPPDKISFLDNVRLFLSAREKVFNDFKSRMWTSTWKSISTNT